ncbi:hypothetical protein GCM10007216_28160 [Thalassobacillus devorans]|uniref:Endonuclease I n=1 Tax=Thalassobacillus devorans TaxID=279813 RepID=A0ABQ1PET7_9BACI|nr:hypothetical protein GCM10007216_28160 [Thalassobacillus devorans]
MTFTNQQKEALLAVTTDRHQLHKILARVKTNKNALRNNEKTYYDEDKDRQSRTAYYQCIDFADPDTLRKLENLLEQTHTNPVRYDPGEYVYPWVDLRPDGDLKSIYSGEKREVEDVIREDYETSIKRKQVLEQVSGKGAAKAQLIQIASQLKFNCEHTVPQSWYDAKEPMRGDIHQLFTCDPLCNSIRSNYPYHDFENYNPGSIDTERIEESCGKAENELFEPEYAKGTVARAMLYFLLRYPDKIEPAYRKKIDVALLYDWHSNFPPTIYERHRNEAIQGIQGNRNPYIDFPEEMMKFS